jgi:hypothetical protein
MARGSCLPAIVALATGRRVFAGFPEFKDIEILFSHAGPSPRLSKRHHRIDGVVGRVVSGPRLT